MKIIYFLKKNKKLILSIISCIFFKIYQIINIIFFNKKNHDFYGGIRFLSTKKNIKTLPEKIILPGDKFCIYFDVDPIGIIHLKVQIGDQVYRGQELIFSKKHVVPVHAPTSGRIVDIKKSIYNNILNKYRIEIFILADGKDIGKKLFPVHNYKETSRENIIKLIYKNGIVGLGGAQFSTARKLSIGINKGNINTLIVNGLESEPYITADRWLIKNHISEILKGCEILQWILKVTHVIIAIEDNQDISIVQIKKKLSYYSGFQLCCIKTRYPVGSSKQLIKLLTGKEIPYNKHSTDIGIIMYNIGTVYAVKRAVIEREPLIKRVVTLTGDALKHSGNMWVRFGISIHDLLLSINFSDFKNKLVITGGPLMGSVVSDFNTPILKHINCILIPSSIEIKRQELETPCIRCARCADVCPMKLLPQQLYWYSKSVDHNKTREYKIENCIECGICEQVCPSRIPLLNYYKQEKKMLNEIDFNKKKFRESKIRFQNTQLRLNSEKKISTENISIQTDI
ncbi:MAG TPA: electron transport complex subunit RsxC [Buchnera sp. (in: enterobacteria)]|nr:electron transport complex subunit RsxC [Buchnera sp. (in: enterobacteria)]